MIKLSKPKKKIIEDGITYLFRTQEQVEKDLSRLVKRYGREDDEEFIEYWRKLLSVKIPVCPICGQSGGPIRRTTDGEILGCDRCLHIAGYYETEDLENLIGVKEVSEILGWPKGKVSEYLKRGKFPEPAASVAATPLWRREQIEEFKKNPSR